MAEKITKTPTKKAAAKPASEKKPVVKKTVTPKSVTTDIPKKPAAKKAVTKKPEALEITTVIIVSDEERYRMIAEAAYYRAESNNFMSDPLRDWIEAERDIDTLLNARR